MKIKHASLTLFIAASVLSLQAQTVAAQPAAQPGSCDTSKRLALVQDEARKLVTDSAALGATTAGSPAVPAPWLEKLRKQADIVKANADKVTAVPAQPDPEAVFYLGKHMNEVQALMGSTDIAPVRAQHAALESLAKHSAAMYKDVGFVLQNAARLKDEAPRCAARMPV